MGYDARTDAELVEASRRGEREAFGVLVSRYQDVVCAVSFSSTGNWALSHDVAQDTFIAAWHQLGQLRDISKLRAWLCGIARNLARKAIKRHRREAAVDDELVAADENPFDQAAQAEVDRVVREALARIPETYRETLVLYFCENRAVRDVAAALGISEDAAMQRLARGRRYLANGVTALVERSLRNARPRKNLVAAVLGALPVVSVSRVDASPRTAGEGSTMLKVGIAATLFAAAVGTTAFVALRDGDAGHAAADTAPATAAKAVATPPAPVQRAGIVAPAPKPALPNAKAAPSSSDSAEPAARVIDKETLAKLGLDRGPSRGPDNAPVTIIVFQDLMCQFCGKVLGTLDEIWSEYPNKLRLVVKQFPVHEKARLAAEASLAADEQGKFWELHDLMMANQDDLSRDAILGYAEQAGLDTARLARALDQHTYAPVVDKELQAGKDIGVYATPTFLINGREVRGARSADAFRAAIDEALAASE